MNITEVKIFKSNRPDRIKAYASITIDNCFVIHDIKVMESNGKVYVAMPNRLTSEKTFFDIVHPISNEARITIEKEIIKKYKEEI